MIFLKKSLANWHSNLFITLKIDVVSHVLCCLCFVLRKVIFKAKLKLKYQLIGCSQSKYYLFIWHLQIFIIYSLFFRMGFVVLATQLCLLYTALHGQQKHVHKNKDDENKFFFASLFLKNTNKVFSIFFHERVIPLLFSYESKTVVI